MRTAAVIGWGFWALGTGALAPVQQSAPPAVSKSRTELVDRLFSAYSAGDRNVVLSQLRTLDECKLIKPQLEPAAKTLAVLWQPVRAAFLLELANDVAKCAPGEAWSLISLGRNYAIGRPNMLGVDRDEDAFELKWHQIAVAILLREHRADIAGVYLDTLDRRYVTSPAAKGAHSTLDPRFVLMRAMVWEQATNQSAMAASLVTGGGPPVSVAGTVESQAAPAQRQLLYFSAPENDTYQRAIDAYEHAAVLPSVAAEASVRLAALQFRKRAYPDALATLTNLVVPEGDSALGYWAALWRGRILDALNRTPESEREFARALGIAPAGQSAAVGLALAQFKQNKRDAAAATAARIAALPADAADPWWIYGRGDGRFVLQWLIELRQELK